MCDDQAGTEERRSRKKGNGENDFAKTGFWPLRQESLEGVKKTIPLGVYCKVRMRRHGVGQSEAARHVLF